MTVKTATDVMRRKAGADRPAPEIGRMTTARAWKLAMPRAAQETLGVQASILKVDESRVVSESLGKLLPEHALIALLEGPEERFGIAILDLPVLAGLVEAATTGRVASRPVVPREPTRTDAIICADLLDALLDGFEAGLAEMDDAPNLAGYRYAAPMADMRAMEMMLAEGPYSVFRLTVDLGGGVRQGDVVVAFPVAARGAARRVDAAEFQKALADNVMGAPTELDALLVRLHLPLSQITGFAVGDVLRVPLGALGSVEIEAAGGKGIANARLGQQGGFRAVRIMQLAGSEAADEADAPDFEEATPRAALPRAEFGLGDDDTAGLPPLADADGDLPDIGELTPLGEEGDSELHDLADLPPLDVEDEGTLPDIPGCPRCRVDAP
jgi:flagellar motor switch protein FliM